MKYFIHLPLTLSLLLAGCQGEQPSAYPTVTPAKIPVVRDVSDADEALNEFRQVDLPAIELADRLVITRVGPKGGPSVTIEDADELREFRNALVVKSIPPSGGKNWAELEWFKDGDSLRKVWIFSDGEWGVNRPGISYTTGLNSGLVERIEHVLSDPQTAEESP